MSKRSAIERFFSHVDKTTPYGPQGECWRWTGAVNEYGYGYFKLDGWRRARASRWCVEHVKGEPIPKGLCVRHTCDTRDCVRPSHLIIGTHAQNTADMLARGRAPWHDGAPKLDADKVREIRKGNASLAALAKRYGVSVTCVYHARKGHTWKDVV